MKYGSGQKIKEVDLIKLQALNLNSLNKQRLEHANQLHYKIRKSTIYIKMNFHIAMPDTAASGFSSLQGCILHLSGCLSQTCYVVF